MPLSVKDVRFMVRRSADGTPTLHPRLLKDRSIVASVDVALQYFETLRGSARRELDPEALVHFFGDYKVARGMVASLGRVYRYRTPRLDQVVTQTAARRLKRLSVGTPGDLRVLVWDGANADGTGFLVGERRATVFGSLEGRLALRSGELDRLLYLDAPEHAILTRLGEVPRAPDILAEYRRSVIAALLAQSERVELLLERRVSGHAEAIRALAEVERVEIDLALDGDGTRLAIRGQADTLGSWTRHGRRIVRFLSRLLERARPAVKDGSALIVARGRRARLRLSTEILDALAPDPLAPAGWEQDPDWTDADVLDAVRPGRVVAGGWRVRRDPEPRAWAAGLLVPDLLIRPGTDPTAGTLVCVVRSAGQAARLASLLPLASGGEPILLAGPSHLVEPLAASGAWTLALDRPALAPILDAVASRALQVAAAQAEAAATRRRRRVA